MMNTTSAVSVNGTVKSMTPADDRRWQAVLARDARSDGAFVYAVRSTGIYGRPSCASRRPRRERVAFFPDAEAAERAGYRACRRCRPAEAGAAPDPWLPKIERACELLARESGRRVTLRAIGKRLGATSFQVQRQFKRITGMTPREYVDAVRLDRLKRDLRKGARVTDALYGAGYGSSSRLYERAPARLGMTPAAYSRGGAGVDLHYAVVDSAIGSVLVAATARGVCAIKIGSDAGALVRELRDEFPHAAITADEGRLASATRQIVAHVAGRRPALQLPLDVRATAFQWQGWRQLMAIPYGATRSYREVAKAIGRPGAARAVARACASNPVALLVPCHRVVPSAGGTGGYRWGAKRKADLLNQERQPAAAATRVRRR